LLDVYSKGLVIIVSHYIDEMLVE